MKFGLSLVILSLILALAGCKKKEQTHIPATPTASLTGTTCGSDRWDVKTASDPAIASVDMQPQSTTVHALVQRQRPPQWHRNLVRQVDLETSPGKPAVEATLWKLTNVKLVEWTKEGDHDIHLVVKDVNGSADEVLDIEFPDVTCKVAILSSLKVKMQQARQSLVTACGNPPSTYKTISGTATIEGIGFFDKTNHGPSGIELHPALSFNGDCH